jgi:hypothetical protein
MSRVRGSVTNNNGFWIGWLDLLTSSFAITLQSPTLHSRCGINKGLIKRGSTIDHWRSRCKGWILWPTPYTYIHTYIYTITLNYHRLQQLTISDCLRLAPSLTGLRVCSTVTDAASDLRIGHFFYERRITYKRTTAFWLNSLLRLLVYWLTQSITCTPFITPGRTEYRTLPSTVHVILCLSVVL